MDYAVPQEQRPRPAKSKALNCLNCRLQKLRCDRHVPCNNCRRSNRSDFCRKHPAHAPPRDTIGRGQRASGGTPVRHSVNLLSPASEQEITAPFVDDSSRQAPRTGAATHERVSNGHRLTQDNIAPRSSPSKESSLAAPDSLNNKVSSLHALAVYRELEARSPQSRLSAPDDIRTIASFTELLESTRNMAQPILPPAGRTITFQWSSSLQAQDLFWKQHLCALLPTRSQCDFLTCYYFENVNWIFQSIHVPSFRKAYSRFWDMETTNIDLIWLSLLYTILSVSALYVPPEAIWVTGIEPAKIRPLAHTWHTASRQALQCGNFEDKPCLTQLQTFSVTQLYWYATNRVETLNSAMAQAIRHAQAIGLDKDFATSTNLETEMRHRAWWDLCGSDTFQSMCLSRPPFIQARLSKVPLPLNCNDIDITEMSIHPRPMDQPTEMTQHIFRARMFKIFNKLYVDDGANLSSYEFVKSIDDEISTMIEDFPWYLTISNGIPATTTLPPDLDFVSWQFHILHTCICTHRIRMYRCFLQTPLEEAWNKCIKAAKDAFIVYRYIRDQAGERFTKSQKFLAQAYQIFSMGVAIAGLLIFDNSTSNVELRNDIEMAITDLGALDTKDSTVALAVEGRKVLARMLSIYDQRGATSPEEPEELVSGISTVFGGEQTARSYLRRYVAVQRRNSVQIMPHSLVDQTRDIETERTDGSLSPNISHTHFNQVQSSADHSSIEFELPFEVFNWWPSELSYMDFTVEDQPGAQLTMYQ
ncbi:hypothetical protein F5884DRAFT_659995 [Xylogone sp. PMI_703]|nr:hypothetical protein F5884DRAFT_659995 [Xylogone sp. PMI_703]